jgi:hypothetical protein
MRNNANFVITLCGMLELSVFARWRHARKINGHNAMPVTLQSAGRSKCRSLYACMHGLLPNEPIGQLMCANQWRIFTFREMLHCTPYIAKTK